MKGSWTDPDPATRSLDGYIARHVYGNTGPHLPLTIEMGNRWLPQKEIIEYRFSECHADPCPPGVVVWLAETKNPRYPEATQQPVIACWALTPYLAYARLRSRIEELNAQR